MQEWRQAAAEGERRQQELLRQQQELDQRDTSRLTDTQRQQQVHKKDLETHLRHKAERARRSMLGERLQWQQLEEAKRERERKVSELYRREEEEMQRAEDERLAT